jgi:hypothetical protein
MSGSDLWILGIVVLVLVLAAWALNKLGGDDSSWPWPQN